jgi:hypothetical protein
VEGAGPAQYQDDGFALGISFSRRPGAGPASYHMLHVGARPCPLKLTSGLPSWVSGLTVSGLTVSGSLLSNPSISG